MSGKMLTRDQLLVEASAIPAAAGCYSAIVDCDWALRGLVAQAIEMLERQDNVVIRDNDGDPAYEMCFVCEQRNYDLHDDIKHSVDCTRADWLARAKAVTSG